MSWIVQSDDNSDSFTITCISSGHNTVSLSGSLQSTLSDERHNTSINGLDPDTLYSCCVTLRDKGVGSTQLCSDVKQPTTLNDGTAGSFSRSTTRQSCTVTLYQVMLSTNRADPSSGAQAGTIEPLSWGLGIVIGVVGGVGTMTAILFTVLLIVLLKLRKGSATKQ